MARKTLKIECNHLERALVRYALETVKHDVENSFMPQYNKELLNASCAWLIKEF